MVTGATVGNGLARSFAAAAMTAFAVVLADESAWSGRRNSRCDRTTNAGLDQERAFYAIAFAMSTKPSGVPCDMS